MEPPVRRLAACDVTGNRTLVYLPRRHPCPAPPGTAAASRRWRAWIALAAIVALAGVYELCSSHTQAGLFAAVAQEANYRMVDGGSGTVGFPSTGPLDIRYGYTRIPEFTDRLGLEGFAITGQANWSPVLGAIVSAGISPPFHPKSRAGLTLFDRDGIRLYDGQRPRRVYRAFEDIPDLVVATLLFIENRELLDERNPYGNPAIELDRLARAVLDTSLHRLTGARAPSGGSTLAVQLQKLRHSPEGRTGTIAEKGRQMLSASLRAYLDGPDTRATRRRLVTDYINSVPLSAVAGVGEVFGLGDGLAHWFGADFDEVNRQLRAVDDPGVNRIAFATHYRRVLTLLAAVKKPSAFLTRDTDALAARVDAYLPALVAAKVIPPWVGDAASRVRVNPHPDAEAASRSFVDLKAADAVRFELASILGVSLYDLDRLDAEVGTSIDMPVTAAVTALLQRLSSCGAAAGTGLVGPRLLPSVDCGQVIYSFTLYERTEAGARLRVQTDTVDQPLNLNDGSRLELGSTAKLRTLVSYLDIVAALHRRYAPLGGDAAHVAASSDHDPLTRWVLGYLAHASDRSLPAMLDAAMTRRYSASPHEQFFTGGGMHVFANFDADDDARVLSVREGFQRSVNLVFIRLMRDIAEHLTDRQAASILRDRTHPARLPLLRRFVAAEPAAAGPDAGWLLTTRRKEAQDRAIRIVLERDAFAALHARWRELGYPFRSLVPSYATAIGSSGDNPAALTRLVGVILDEGVQTPLVRVETIRLGAHTPYDTVLEQHSRREPVLDPQVAAVLRRELIGVVEHGTGRRLAGGITLPSGKTVSIGGKTGTGDNRLQGRSSRVLNRTATFVFIVGDRFFGTVVAYVPGSAAAHHTFTSALPVQLFKHLLPAVQPLFERSGATRAEAPSSSETS